MRELPAGWNWVSISDITEKVTNIKPDDYPDKEFGYVDISSICNSTYRITEVKRFKGADAPSRARRPIQTNDILFSNVRTYLRNVALVPNDTDAQICSTGFTVLRPKAAVDPQFLFRYVLTNDFIDRVTPQQTGTHYPATSDRVVLSELIPLPTLDEQRRIVAKLEELLDKVEACQKRLAKVPVIIKRFRQSVLAAACSGRLTADWREQTTCVAPVQKRLAEHGRRRGFSAIGAHDVTSSWPALPDTWACSGIGSLLCTKRTAMKTGPFGSMLKKSEHQRHGVPVLGIENIGFMRFKRGSKICITIKKANELSEYEALPGDVLISRSGTVGEVCVVPDDVGEARISTNLMRITLAQQMMLPMFFCYLFNGSPLVLRQVADMCKGSTREFLNQGILKALLFPVPPRVEQEEIVRRVDVLLNFANAFEARYEKAKAQVDKLTQSILAKAFCGELIPTKP